MQRLNYTNAFDDMFVGYVTVLSLCRIGGVGREEEEEEEKDARPSCKDSKVRQKIHVSVSCMFLFCVT